MQLRRKLILTCGLQEIDIYPREHILWKHVSTDELMQFMIKEGSNVPRKGHIQKRDVLADPLYNDKVVTKLINNIMLDGKREHGLHAIRHPWMDVGCNGHLKVCGMLSHGDRKSVV